MFVAHPILLEASNCLLPFQWKYELTLEPANADSSLPSLLTDGSALIHGRWISAKCQLNTWTFMNKYRRLHNSDATTNSFLPTVGDYLDNNEGKILVTCNNGVFAPDIFTSETQWCARGCLIVDPNFLNTNHMRVEYPRGSRSLDSFTAPVVRDLTLDITLSCRLGYGITRASFNRSTTTQCSFTGYKPKLTLNNYRNCVPGCSDPTLLITNSTLTKNSSTPGGVGVFGAGESVVLRCVEGYTLLGAGYRKCRRVSESDETVEWDPPLGLIACVQNNNYTIKSGGRQIVRWRWWVTVGVCTVILFLEIFWWTIRSEMIFWIWRLISTISLSIFNCSDYILFCKQQKTKMPRISNWKWQK